MPHNLLSRYGRERMHPVKYQTVSSLLRLAVKMLILLLGIILLHIAALVLLFVSTIVSVSGKIKDHQMFAELSM